MPFFVLGVYGTVGNGGSPIGEPVPLRGSIGFAVDGIVVVCECFFHVVSPDKHHVHLQRRLPKKAGLKVPPLL